MSDTGIIPTPPRRARAQGADAMCPAHGDTLTECPVHLRCVHLVCTWPGCDYEEWGS